MRGEKCMYEHAPKPAARAMAASVLEGHGRGIAEGCKAGSEPVITSGQQVRGPRVGPHPGSSQRPKC
jgi:hypothetical protein